MSGYEQPTMRRGSSMFQVQSDVATLFFPAAPFPDAGFLVVRLVGQLFNIHVVHF